MLRRSGIGEGFFFTTLLHTLYCVKEQGGLSNHTCTSCRMSLSVRIVAVGGVFVVWWNRNVKILEGRDSVLKREATIPICHTLCSVLCLSGSAHHFSQHCKAPCDLGDVLELGEVLLFEDVFLRHAVLPEVLSQELHPFPARTQILLRETELLERSAVNTMLSTFSW